MSFLISHRSFLFCLLLHHQILSNIMLLVYPSLPDLCFWWTSSTQFGAKIGTRRHIICGFYWKHASTNATESGRSIVASFSGGAVGVISALMVVEINNVKQQEHKRCKYCLGTGYLACARCSNTGSLVLIEPVSTIYGADKPLSPPKTERCSNCSGSGKVMCPTCLCTGMAMASEHDPRIDPFD